MNTTIRLADAILKSDKYQDKYGADGNHERQQFFCGQVDALAAIRDGEIVTPADEALAELSPQLYMDDRERYRQKCCHVLANEYGNLSASSSHATDCAWVEACRKVATLKDRTDA